MGFILAQCLVCIRLENYNYLLSVSRIQINAIMSVR